MSRALALAAVLLPALTYAAPAPAPKRAKVAVLDVRAVGTFDPKMVQGLSTLVASEVEKGPFKVVAGSDLSALIGFEKQKQLLGCSEGSCLAEIGGALGVEYLLSTEVSEIGGVWLLSTTLLDVARSNALKRVTRRTEKLKQLIDLAQLATAEALAAIPSRDPRPAPSDPPRAEPGKDPAPDLALAAPADAPMSSTRKAGIALDVAGGAMLVGGVVCGILSGRQFDQAKKATDPAAFDSARKTGKTEAFVADVLYGAGAVALGVGLVLTLIGGPDAPAPAPVSLAPAPGGATLVFSGGF